MDALIFWPPAVSMRHQYWRFVTCGLIHADFMHLAFNMFTLYFFGKALENLYMGELGLQHYYFLILYILGLIFANIPTYLKRKDDYNYRSLGASGAVCAVVFAAIIIRPWAEIWLYGIRMPALIYAVLFMVYSIYMSKRGGDNVNHDAHIWGAVFGIVFTIIVDHEVFGNFINALRHPNF
jgi:membrane associated rhomboid family serine protease